MHYWYMPDSYDAWIPLHEVDNKEVCGDCSRARSPCKCGWVGGSAVGGGGKACG